MHFINFLKNLLKNFEFNTSSLIIYSDREINTDRDRHRKRRERDA